jgi:hypothetical protein
MATRLLLALVLVVFVRRSKNLFFVYFTFRPLYTTVLMIINRKLDFFAKNKNN